MGNYIYGNTLNQIDQVQPQTPPQKIYLKKLKLNDVVDFNNNNWTLVDLDSTNDATNRLIIISITQKMKISQFQKFLSAPYCVYNLDINQIHFTQGKKSGYCDYYIFGSLNTNTNDIELLVYRIGSDETEIGFDFDFDFDSHNFINFQERLKKDQILVKCELETPLTTITNKIVDFDMEQNDANLSMQKMRDTIQNLFQEKTP